MKKNLTIRINLIIAAIIIFGFIATTLINYNTYSVVINDDIKNISKLTTTNIYSNINNELTKPIFVSLTMANNNFLKEWLANEAENKNNDEYIKKLQHYLLGLKDKYNYNSVFVVSDKSKNYYHYEGVQKSISEENQHDAWYYSFAKSSKLYDLDVDNDEVKDNKLTVFVNCRIEDSEGDLMGVAGVGLEMEKVQTILKDFEDDFDLEAFLVDPNGVVQVHTNGELIETLNIFENTSINKFGDSIIANKEGLEILRYKEEGVDGYLITRYIDELDWYLVVKKDTSVLANSFKSQMIKDLLIIGLVLMLLIILSTGLLRKYNKQMNSLAKTDQLTKISNRRAFDEHIIEATEDYTKNKRIFNVFLFDIDGLKKVNDTQGHLFGDKVIFEMGKLSQDLIGDSGVISRWGGDEFAGIIYGTLDEAEKIAKDIVEYTYNSKKFKDYGITISLGLTPGKELDTSESVMNRADMGLYEAKVGGKNRMHILK